ncbi:hypothetical protein BsWGS_05608 [Bradybaena similaris]
MTVEIKCQHLLQVVNTSSHMTVEMKCQHLLQVVNTSSHMIVEIKYQHLLQVSTHLHIGLPDVRIFPDMYGFLGVFGASGGIWLKITNVRIFTDVRVYRL